MRRGPRYFRRPSLSPDSALVVVLLNGSALSAQWEKAHANAILEAWYPGEEGGTAIAATLSGKNNPAGRLPVTFYQDVHQLPHFEEYSMKGRTYRYFEKEPLWPFGYGMSYTTFEYSGLALPSAPVDPEAPVNVRVTVSNIGKVAGDEVAQLYLKFPDIAGAPLRALRGFKRIHLEPGASQQIEFHLQSRDLNMVTEAAEIIVARGKYTLSVGGGQPDTGAASKPRCWGRSAVPLGPQSGAAASVQAVAGQGTRAGAGRYGPRPLNILMMRARTLE